MASMTAVSLFDTVMTRPSHEGHSLGYGIGTVCFGVLAAAAMYHTCHCVVCARVVAPRDVLFLKRRQRHRDIERMQKGHFIHVAMLRCLYVCQK